MIRALGGWISSFQAFMIVNSYIDIAEDLLELLPDKATLEMIRFIVDFQFMSFCWNIA